MVQGDAPSRSYFKHTVYGFRFLFRIYDRADKAIRLPSLKRQKKLPVVLSTEECKKLFRSGRILKHRVLLSLVSSADLRSKEVRNLRLEDIDTDRMILHIRKTRYNKDRYVPLSEKIVFGLRKYSKAYHPKDYRFNGKSVGTPLSPKGVRWAMKEIIKRSGIRKPATIHSLRHSYTTHIPWFI